MKKTINVLVKPTNSCNLRCIYCFHEKSHYNKDLLEISKFQRFIELASKAYDRINIIWHGGEPLCAPMSFYEKAYEVCSSYDAEFSYSMQTNGTLINSDIIRFFQTKNTSFGISYDGLDNDYTRGLTQNTLSALELLKLSGACPGVIMVLTARNIMNLKDDYEYFNSSNISVKFNPLFVDGAATHESNLQLNYVVYAKEISKLFLHWLFDTKCVINIATFTEIVKLVMNMPAGVCTYSSCIHNWLCLDPSGDIYPCDRFSNSAFMLANISEIKKFEDIFNNDTFKELLVSAINRRYYCNEHCDAYSMCYGGCNANSFLVGSIDKPNEYFCNAHRLIIDNVQSAILEQAKIAHKSDNLNPKFIKLIKSLTDEYSTIN